MGLQVIRLTLTTSRESSVLRCEHIFSISGWLPRSTTLSTYQLKSLGEADAKMESDVEEIYQRTHLSRINKRRQSRQGVFRPQLQVSYQREERGKKGGLVRKSLRAVLRMCQPGRWGAKAMTQRSPMSQRNRPALVPPQCPLID